MKLAKRSTEWCSQARSKTLKKQRPGEAAIRSGAIGETDVQLVRYPFRLDASR